MNASNNGSGAEVLDGWARDVADATASLDKRGDRQMAARLMRLHTDILAMNVTIESAMALPGKWRGEAEGTRGCRQEHDADSAYDDALDGCADELEAIFGPAPPAGGGASHDARDAARYRWLRDVGHPDHESGIAVGVEGTNSWGKSCTSYPAGPELDAAIDAAMGETPAAAGGARVGQEWQPIGTAPTSDDPFIGNPVILLKDENGNRWADVSPGDCWMQNGCGSPPKYWMELPA